MDKLGERIKNLHYFLKANPDVSIEAILYEIGTEVAQLEAENEALFEFCENTGKAMAFLREEIVKANAVLKADAIQALKAGGDD